MKSTTEQNLSRQKTDNSIFNIETSISLLDQLYPRLMAQIDRDTDSPTYGSCDRHYWLYHMQDFTSGVLQQTSLTLTALYILAEKDVFRNCRNLNRDHSQYYRELAEAVNRYTVRMFGNKGMLDEYFPGEHSYPGTVFTAYAALKSALLLDQDEILNSKALKSAAESLLSMPYAQAVNQSMAAAAFLSLYSKTHSWKAGRVKDWVYGLLDSKMGIGRFFEYGGIDLGYASVSLNYLSCISVDTELSVSASLEELSGYISRFISPNGRLGGEFTSRSTTYALPFGFLESSFQNPHLIRDFKRINFREIFRKLDDRYINHYTLPSLAMTALRLHEAGPISFNSEPGQPSGWDRFIDERSGLASFRNNHAAVFIGLNKGGTLHVENKEKSFIDCGYRIHRGGKSYATSIISEQPEFSIQHCDNQIHIKISARFGKYRRFISKSWTTVLLRTFSPLIRIFRPWVRRSLVEQPDTLSDTFLKRTICIDLDQNRLKVDDEFEGIQSGDKLSVAGASSLRLVPSSKFYQPGEEKLNRYAKKISADSRQRNIVLNAD